MVITCMSYLHSSCHSLCQCIKKHPVGQVVGTGVQEGGGGAGCKWLALSTLDHKVPRLNPAAGRILAYDCMALHSTKPFIITLPPSQYDTNNVESDVKHQTIIIMSVYNSSRIYF